VAWSAEGILLTIVGAKAFATCYGVNLAVREGEGALFPRQREVFTRVIFQGRGQA
jgi:hypothetical protein